MSTQLNDTLTGHARQHHHLIDCCELRNYVCRKFLRKRSLYEYPLPSCEINVCTVSLICPETATVLFLMLQFSKNVFVYPRGMIMNLLFCLWLTLSSKLRRAFHKQTCVCSHCYLFDLFAI